MLGKIRTAIAVGIVLCVIPVTVLGQNITVPTSTKNTRFDSDVFNIKRPGLSINGFDNGGDDSFGYGLKQVLEKTIIDQDPEISAEYNKIKNTATDLIVNPSTASNPLGTVDQNSNILQCRAFMALAEYILYKNGQATASDYDTAIESLRSAFFEPPDYLLAYDDVSGDAVKWTRSIGDYARALDLYLALENAYKYYGFVQHDRADSLEYINSNSSTLLTKTKKEFVMSNLFYRMQAVNNILYHETFPGHSDYKFEPGNRPLKQFVSIGYAALGMQNFLYYNPDNETYIYTSGPCNTLLQNAFHSAGLQSASDRTEQWSYQTHNGDRFWAEGPYYFEFTLNDIIPFWNAIRLNGMLNWNGNNISDPFKSGWFLRPLDWLADIATQAGQLPPLDDGNKHSIRYASLMRWNTSYSSSTDPEYPGGSTALGDIVGTKFAWIYNQIKDTDGGLDESTILTEIAIPKASTPSSSPLPAVTGNADSSQTGDDAEQQAIVRHTDSNGNNYYLLVNGESVDAIGRGEGHEQADQLQLLYYVNGVSYIMDTGYDKATPTTNSTWNKYDDHNVLNVHDMVSSQDNGLPGPTVEDDKLRKIADHHSVSYLYINQINNVTVIDGHVPLDHYNDLGQSYNSGYTREVLFVNNDQLGLSPYIVDLNTDVHSYLGYEGDRIAYTPIMQYYSDTRNIDYSAYNSWIKLTGYRNGYNGISDNMYVFLNPVEWKVHDSGFTFSNNNIMVREVQGRDVDPSNQSGYPATVFGLNAPNAEHSNSASFVSIIQLSNNVPNYTLTPLISYADDNYQREVQAWSYQISNNVIDVVVKRAKVNGPSDSQFNNDVTFTVPQAYYSTLTLSGGKDYGFARMKKVGNTWSLDENYQINLNLTGTGTYLADTTLGTYTFPANSTIFIGDNSTVTITGTLTLQSGTTIQLGTGAGFQTTSGGKIIANGSSGSPIKFVRLNPYNAWGQVTLKGNGNQFTWCLFDGGTNTVDVENENTQFYNCTFRNGVQGISSNTDQSGGGGQTFFRLNYCMVENNSDVGVSVYHADAQFYYCTIQDNGTAGIYLYDSPARYFFENMITGNNTVQNSGRAEVEVLGGSDVDLLTYNSNMGEYFPGQNRIANDFYYQIKVDGSSTLLMGDASTFSEGDNGIFSNYSLSRVNNQNYWNTIDAYGNWWGSPDPSSLIFSGPIDYSDPLFYDPSTSAGVPSGSYPTRAVNSPQLMMGGGTTNESPSQITADSARTQSEKDLRRARIHALWTDIAKATDAQSFMRDMQELYKLHMMSRGDTSFSKEMTADQALWNMAIQHYLSGNQKLAPVGVKLSPDQAQNLMVMDEHEAYRFGRYDEARSKATKYDSYITSARGKIRHMADQMNLLDQQGAYKDELAMLDKVKQAAVSLGESRQKVDSLYQIPRAKIQRAMERQTAQMAKAASGGPVEPEAETPSTQPAKTTLKPNYPNPFNPTTTIRYELAQSMNVRLTVYNVLGQRVAVLVEGRQSAGWHQATFNAMNLSSGLYFYRLQAGNKVLMRKMLLLK